MKCVVLSIVYQNLQISFTLFEGFGIHSHMRYNYIDVKNIFTEQGCELLEEEYLNNSHKMKYRCVCGNISEISLSHFRRGQRCSICRYAKTANALKLDFGYIEKIFEEQGCELLEHVYKNARTKMRYRCVCGRVSSICFDSFKNGNRCRKCGNAKSSKVQKLSQEEVAAVFNIHNCVLLDQYVSSLKPVKFVCSCGNESTILLSNFQKRKQCSQCGLKSRSGKNHYEWRADRDVMQKELLFRQRCYKLVRMVLNVTGRVKNKKTTELLGYDYKQLQEHITNHPNYDLVKSGRWHIDHIFPIKAFVDHNIESLALINCLENLRPISMVENCSKNGKYDINEFRNWLEKKGVSYAT